MKLPNISFRSAAFIVIGVMMIGLLLSPVSAASGFFSFGNTTSNPSVDHHHAFNSTQMTAQVQGFLTNLSAQGVDVSTAQADLSSGNMTAVFQWLMAYHQANPGSAMIGAHQHAFNSTMMTTRLQSAVTKLGQNGVDVSQVQADLSSGNLTATMQWMAAYHKAHPSQKGNTTAMQGFNSTQRNQNGGMRHAGFGNTTAWHGFNGTQRNQNGRIHQAGSGNQSAWNKWFVATPTQGS